MSKLKITPVGDRILVQYLEEKEQIRGGLIIPDSAKEQAEAKNQNAILGSGVKPDSSLRPSGSDGISRKP